MDVLESFQSKTLTLYNLGKEWSQENPRAAIGVGLGISAWGLHKLHKIYQRSKLQFDSSSEDLSRIGIVITGCSSGIGYDVAMRLNSMGYCVIPCNRRESSVNDFNNNQEFTKNGSFSIQMDVSNKESVENGSKEISKWLSNDSSRKLWCVINNAGIIYPMNFEILPHDWMMREYNVNLFGVVYVTRYFLPLIYGRTKQGQRERERGLGSKIGGNSLTNGGRIINVSSLIAKLPLTGMTRYGSGKAAISYLSHSLRGEYASTYGIWSSTIELGPFNTNVLETAKQQANAMSKYYNDGKKNNTLNDRELNVIDTFNINKMIELTSQELDAQNSMGSDDTSVVVDDIVDACLKQYPKRIYCPGVHGFFAFAAKLPLSMLDRMNWMQANEQKKKLDDAR